MPATPPRRAPAVAVAVATLLAAAVSAARGQPAGPPTPASAAAPAPARADTLALDAYVGRYADAPDADMILSVYREGAALYFQPTENPRFALAAAGRDTFDVPAIRHRLVFVRDAGGAVTGVRVRGGGGEEHPVTPRLDGRPDVVRFVEMTRTDTMIPMRDGTRLHTVIIAPANAAGPLPVLLERTPYGVGHWDPTRVNVAHRALVQDGRGGYIFAFQDIRGRFGSGGRFAMIRPPHPAAGARGPRDAVDESTDAYDSIDWLVRHVPGNSGRVGVRGISYGGWLATMALRHPHPALRAASPQAPVGDMWRGDDFFHNGAFRLSYGHEFAVLLETSRDSLTEDALRLPPAAPGAPAGDAYDWYLRQGPLSAITARLGGRLPTWTAFTRHPNYDAYWRARAADRQVNRPGDRRVPTLVVGGRWDQEDMLGPLATYAALERGDARGQNTLVLGPWHHGQWSAGPARRLGALPLGGATGWFFRDSVEAPWFAHHLKDAPAPGLPEALVFHTGANRWERHAQWPPRPAAAPAAARAAAGRPAPRALYLREGGRLAFDAPSPAPGAAPGDAPDDTAGADRYVSDPAAPVPYRARPIGGTFGPDAPRWWTWLADDQRFVAGRPDVVAWRTEPLADDVTVAGDVTARLFASTTGTDADWVVKLIDVYPDSGAPALGADSAMAGYQLMVAGDVLRGRFRGAPDRPAPVRPGAVEAYPVPLRAVAHTFRRGHRIMVQVQSSWFPLYDRNPQTYVPNLFDARPADFRASTHRVFRTARFPSRLELPGAR